MDLGAKSLATAATAITITAAVAALLVLVARRLAAWAAHPSTAPPLVTGRNPLLGCSLAYQADPVGFLQSTCRQHGEAFTLDMAGTHMSILADAKAVSQYSCQRDSQLDSTAALVPFGFVETLGRYGAMEGAAMVTRALKAVAAGGPALTSLCSDLSRVTQQVLREVATAAAESGVALKLCPLLRQVSLHAVANTLFGRGVAEALPPQFYNAFAKFQDAQEHATAQAIALPKALVQLFFIRPVVRQRLQLQQMLTKALQSASSDSISSFLAEIVAVSRQRWEGKEADEAVAQFMVSTLFSGHKNPAIGAAYTIAAVLEDPALLSDVRKELDAATVPGASIAAADTPLLDACINEALRKSVHCIGTLRRVVGTPWRFTTTSGKSYTLPVGCLVGTSQSSLSYSTSCYTQPDKFDPYRFMPERNEHKQPGAGFWPFSDGIHRCPGRSLAMCTMRTMVAVWLKEYDTHTLQAFRYDFTKATLAQVHGKVMVKRRPH